jgi:hypothetical protein
MDHPVLIGLVVLLPVALVVALLRVTEWRRAWQLSEIERQIAVTDAIHAELGAVVSPTVRRRLGNRWQLAIAVPFDNLDTVTRVVESASRAFDVARAKPGRFELVLSPQERPVRHTARAATVARPTRGESVSWI